jgi:hypothetical protein
MATIMNRDENEPCQRVAQCAEVNTGYQTRSLIFSDAETIEAGTQAHKPADSGVVVVPYARMRRLRLSGDVDQTEAFIAPTGLIASKLAPTMDLR